MEQKTKRWNWKAAKIALLKNAGLENTNRIHSMGQNNEVVSAVTKRPRDASCLSVLDATIHNVE